jgi:hypothetical protein
MNVYVLSELSIWPLLADVVRRRPVTILGVWARLRLFTPVLNRLAALLVRLARVDDIADIPGLPWHERMPGRGGFYNDVHHRAESELWRRFDLPADDPLAAQYSYAFRKATTGTVGSLTPIYLTVEWLSENRPADSWRLIGAPPLLQELADILAPPLPPFTPDRKFLALSNAVNLVSMGVMATFWLLWRTRWRVHPEVLDLMADEADDFDRALIHRAAAVGKNFAVLDRSLDHRHFQGSKLTPYRHCLREDARVTPAVAIGLIGTVIGELIALWRRHHRLDSGLNTQWGAQIIRRAVFAALFQRFRPKIFWSRDDYSSEHIVRNLELRKIGCRCIGMAHGLPINTYVHMWREVDFDVYFTFGRHLTRYYADSWAPGMKIIPTGPFRQPHDMRQRIGSVQRNKDIIFLAMAAVEMLKIGRVVCDVAAHFQDRRVLVKMKHGRSQEDNALFTDSFAGASANLTITTDDTYELMLAASYALTSGSSTTVEALSFGLKTFVIDVDPTLRAMYYRNFPGLTVNDAQTIINRIEAIEAGEEEYDFNAYSDLVVLDGPHPVDVIAAELHLYPNQVQMVDHAP